MLSFEATFSMTWPLVLEVRLIEDRVTPRAPLRSNVGVKLVDITVMLDVTQPLARLEGSRRRGSLIVEDAVVVVEVAPGPTVNTGLASDHLNRGQTYQLKTA